jgi:hypothetical protein
VSEAYEQELAEVRVAELMATLEKLYAYAKERGDTMARMRTSELYDALKWYKDSKAKGEE